MANFWFWFFVGIQFFRLSSQNVSNLNSSAFENSSQEELSAVLLTDGEIVPKDDYLVVLDDEHDENDNNIGEVSKVVVNNISENNVVASCARFVDLEGEIFKTELEMPTELFTVQSRSKEISVEIHPESCFGETDLLIVLSLDQSIFNDPNLLVAGSFRIDTTNKPQLFKITVMLTNGLWNIGIVGKSSKHVLSTAFFSFLRTVTFSSASQFSPLENNSNIAQGLVSFGRGTSRMSLQKSRWLSLPSSTPSPHSWSVQLGAFCTVMDEVTFELDAPTVYDMESTSLYPLKHFTASVSALSLSAPRSIVIGSHVYLGRGVTVLAGSCIGEGAVLLPHSVVTGDVPPYAVVGGNPGRVQRFRHSQHVIDSLLLSRWEDESDNDALLDILTGKTSVEAVIATYLRQ